MSFRQEEIVFAFTCKRHRKQPQFCELPAKEKIRSLNSGAQMAGAAMDSA
jgi:hypothetical protein